MTRRKQREDPEYLQAMREAKELFDAEMLKNAMRRSSGRPPKVATPAVEVTDEGVQPKARPRAPQKAVKAKKR